MPRFLGDYDQNTVVYGDFTTVANSNSVAQTLANGNIVVFKDNSNANSVQGVTLNTDWGVTGRHLVTVNTAANNTYYANGGTFHVVAMNGNVAGTSVSGYGLFSFTMRLSSSLKPIVAGRTLGVDAFGNVNANVTGTVNANVATWLGSAPNPLVSGRVDALVGSMNAGVIASGTIASGELNNIADALLDRANAIEVGITPRLAWRYTGAAAAGNMTGGNTTTTVFAGIGVATTRITATVQSDGDVRVITYS